MGVVAAIDESSVGRCSHCGRLVAETRHSPAGYRVDYYSLRTGEVEPTSVTTDTGVQFVYFKLTTVVDIVTCVDCYRLPAVQRERDERFRPERFAQAEVSDDE